MWRVTGCANACVNIDSALQYSRRLHCLLRQSRGDSFTTLAATAWKSSSYCRRPRCRDSPKISSPARFAAWGFFVLRARSTSRFGLVHPSDARSYSPGATARTRRLSRPRHFAEPDSERTGQSALNSGVFAHVISQREYGRLQRASVGRWMPTTNTRSAHGSVHSPHQGRMVAALASRRRCTGCADDGRKPRL